jgi:hypothetical protein
MLEYPSILVDEVIILVKLAKCGQSAGKFTLYIRITPQRLHAKHPIYFPFLNEVMDDDIV